MSDAPIEVTSSAAKRINAIVSTEGRPEMRLRVSVSGGGCSGFQYNFVLDDSAEDGDVLVERDGAKVVVDGLSLPFIAGSKIDFVENLTGAYFMVDNPNASSSCGCGTSFSI